MLVHPAGTGGPLSRVPFVVAVAFLCTCTCGSALTIAPPVCPHFFAGRSPGGIALSILPELVAVFFLWVLSDIAATALSWQRQRCPPNFSASSPSFFRWA